MAQWKPPSYATPVDSSKSKEEEIKTEEVEEPRSLASRAWDYINKPTTDVLSRIAHTVSEPMMQYGESGDDLLHKAALYGGAYTQSLGDVATEMTNPLNLGLAIATEGSSLAATRGLPSIARALETPGRVAAAGMVGHGGYKAATGDNTPERLAGIVEAVMGGFGLKSHSKIPDEVPNEIPISEAPIRENADDLLRRITEQSPDINPQEEANSILSGNRLQGERPKITNRPRPILQNEADKIIPWEPPEYAKAIDEGIKDESGRVVAPLQPEIKPRPDGPWNENRGEFKGPIEESNINPIDELTYRSYKQNRLDNPQVSPERWKSIFGDSVDSMEPRFTKESNTIDISAEKPKIDIPEEKPTAKYSSFQPDDTHPEGGFHLYDIQGGPSNGSSVSAETLNKMGIEVPPTPETPKGKIVPPQVKDYLTAKGLKPEEVDALGPEQAISKMQEIRRGGELDPKRQVPITPETEDVRNPVGAINRLKDALTQSDLIRGKQSELQSAEKSRRIGAAESIKTPGLAGHYQRLGMLKGELPKIPLESKLTQVDVDSLIDAVTNSQLKPYQKINASVGLTKILAGKTVQPYESKLLGQVFGKDLEDIIMLHGGLGTPGFKIVANEAINIPKSVMATMDLSAPLRQGLPLIHRPEYWRSFKDMFSYFGNEETFTNLQSSLETRPKFDIGHEAGLHLSDVGSNLEGREEQFLSPLVGKIPLIGGVARASERAYVGFLNKLRADVFDNMLDQAVAMGRKPEEVAGEIAKFVNTSTGRGSLGRFEKNAVDLNAALFSPRLIASRLTMLNPNYYIQSSPMVRKEALKSLFAVAAAGSIFAGASKAAGADVNMNPTSSDFGKVKIGRVRLDPYGGFQQYIVAAARLASGKETSTGGREYDLAKGKFPGPTRFGVLSNFARSKESPVASFIDNLLSGQQAFTPGGMGKLAMDKTGASRPSAEIINRFTPMVMNDLVDLYRSDPNLLPLGIPAMFGMGLQTMDEKPKASPFRINAGIGVPRY